MGKGGRLGRKRRSERRMPWVVEHGAEKVIALNARLAGSEFVLTILLSNL
jgi:hypothetical protein